MRKGGCDTVEDTVEECNTVEDTVEKGGCNPMPCTPGRHRVGRWPDIPFVYNQFTAPGIWGHRDAAHRPKETRLAAVICSRSHGAAREQRLQWLALMVR
ncbi:hypothetical protein HaLaN_25748 [Haematococcus lacustris]|uniref:Uncharacterized protein n=1 Tax=Haematococcus lacustris TaxID=44745 RepID=A0A6A0A319_HAELA|nr:hypothetical protein HaLaN_25748 [Haematococcus lacustris]